MRNPSLTLATLLLLALTTQAQSPETFKTRLAPVALDAAMKSTIAGTGAANPLAMFLSAAMMLRHGFGSEAQAAAVESAVDRALADGLRTHDLGGDASTAQATQAVLKHL